MNVCPYCRRKFIDKRKALQLPWRQKIIYDRVVESGDDGVKTESLVSLIDSPGPGGRVVLRVQVHELNRKLRRLKQRVRGRGGRYWLMDKV